MRRNFYKEFTPTEIGEPLPAATCYKALPPKPIPGFFTEEISRSFFPVLVKPTPLPGIRTERNKTKEKKYHQESPISRKKNPKITALKKEYMIPTVPVIANTAPGKDGPGVVSLPLLLLIVTSRPDIPICSSAMVRHYPHILRWNLRSAVKLMVDLKGEEEPVIWDLRTGTWRLWMRSRFPS